MLSVGSLTPAQAIHERICLLYLMLTDNRSELLVTDWGIETGWGLNRLHTSECPEGREGLFKQLADALWAYEEITGREDHPVGEKLDDIDF
ncbi:hypothetical protein [Roseivivax sp. THAF197b]|uniref:hypothetical protein n=1 Tax=Roseivivax sp. THAF197b TaxID=2588299 RepID=UPI0012A897B9|nr:hypothetical protein [Roseivivax sp. THAF197b]QFS82291.1 hypothetical protein FIV09_05575 [Roseivivax sp. THAF197b]